LIIAVTVAAMANRRKKLFDRSGQRICVAYCGGGRWRRWPLVKSIVAMAALALAQLGLAAAFAVTPSAEVAYVHIVIYQVQLGWFTGVAVSRFRWRVYPHAMEFFDNGVALHGWKFYGWSRAEVRPSTLYADRVVVVLQIQPGSIGGETKIARVTGTLRERVLAAPARHD
jgi:hypothetical protein